MEIAFNTEKNSIIRSIKCGHYINKTELPFYSDKVEVPIASTEWAKNEFSIRHSFSRSSEGKSVKVVDLFCGSGGLSLGIQRALAALNLKAKFLLACDSAKESLDVYKANFKPRLAIRENVVNLINGPVGGAGYQHHMDDYSLDSRVANLEEDVDIFIAGPPCEGHSNLNNKTRRKDIRNELYVYAALIAAKLKPKIVIIENVPTVLRANQEVVRRAGEILTKEGYTVFADDMIFASNNLLVGQLRRRHFLVAVRDANPEVEFPLKRVKFPNLTAWDVIGDLAEITSDEDLMLKPSNVSSENKNRIDYLFDHGEYDLPDQQRPDCHRLKPHTYPSVYGRMYADQPCSTITTGFQSPGRGRFIHPTKRRCLTPREGARIQGFPDSFRWCGIGIQSTKNSVTRLIGDAVPPNLGMFVALAAIDLMADEF